MNYKVLFAYSGLYVYPSEGILKWVLFFFHHSLSFSSFNPLTIDKGEKEIPE